MLPFGDINQLQFPSPATNATMQPEYTNHITTASHPRFGPLRLIHLDGEPWLCLIDINRILESTESAWGETLLSNRQVQHASGITFVRLSLPVERLVAPRDELLDWLASILTSGWTGHSPACEHADPGIKRGPRMKLVSSLTVDASSIYAFTDRPMAYADWLLDRETQFRTALPDKTAWASHFSIGRLPIITAAVEIDSLGQSELSWLARIVLDEALHGWHTQDSLDRALTLCTKLQSDPSDQMDARALHAFLGIPASFPVWFNKQVYRDELVHGQDYFTSNVSRFLPIHEEDATFDVGPRFSVATAMSLMMRLPTLRGTSIRHHFIRISKVVEERLGILNPIEKVQGKVFTGLE
ncbi:MAG: antA/AntB antirepressor family protein [Akkermansiaceae bacterium]|nr:antA/AntB antirepressor family protein [Akkermansiaceae bacterium]